MSLQYVKSKKGRDQLLYDGYLHTKERVFGNKTVWKCASYHQNRCPGRAHTRDDLVVKYSAHHHPPGKAARAAKRRERGTKTPSGPQLAHQVVLPNPGGLPETVPAKKLCFQNVKQTIQRLRECLSATRPGIDHPQTLSATVAESVPEDPSSGLSVIPPDSHERSERFKDGNFMAAPVHCEEPRASHPALFQASQEAGRQRFRSGAVPPGANPQEILSQISEAAQQWLRPQEHDKDQIVDMVILEQFLAVLPVGMQAWVRAAEPRNSTEAVRLAETYLEDQEPSRAGQELKKDPITFEDVSLRFSEEEWASLDQDEKALYWNIMHQNYENVAWLTGGETGSKGKEDPWQEAPEYVVELLKKSNKEVPWGFKQNSVRENHLERQPKTSSEEKDVSLFISDLKETTRDAELGLETRCEGCNCGKGDKPSSLVGSRKSHREEDPEPTILSGELEESSQKEIPQNSEEKIIKEDQKDMEIQQSNPRVEDNLFPFGEVLRDRQDSRLGQETPCMAVDGGDQDEPLTLLHDQNIYIEDDFECVALPEGSLFISVEEISQSPEENSQSEPIHIYSLRELNRTYSQVGVDETAALTSQKTIILDREQISSPEVEVGEETSVLSGNGLTADQFFVHAQPTLEPLPTGSDPEESSEHSSSQKSSQGEDLCEGPSYKKPFILSSASTTQPNCSDSGESSGSLSVLIKRRRLDKKRKLCSGRNMPVSSVVGTQQRLYPGGKPQKHPNLKNRWASRKRRRGFPELQMGLRAPWEHSPVNINAQPHETLHMATETHRTTSEAASSSDSGEAKLWQRAPSPSLLDKMAAEPIMVRLMAVLEKVAADTAEIKSMFSRLHPTIAGIQNALENLSDCIDDAEHRVSDLEFASQNTKAQLVQLCSDIKAIEGKVVGKAVHTNVIAGLWPSLGIKREMSP